MPLCLTGTHGLLSVLSATGPQQSRLGDEPAGNLPGNLHRPI